MAVPVDGPEVLIAEGTRTDGVSWRIWAQRHPPGADFPDEDELQSTIRIAGPDGRTLHGGGSRGPALSPGKLMDVSTGGSDEGPRTLLARVHPVIRRAELRTTGGEIIDVPVYDSEDFPEIRFAALLVPRDSHLDYVAGLNDEGEEVERFSLAFHDLNWHRFRARTGG